MISGFTSDGEVSGEFEMEVAIILCFTTYY